MATSNIVESAVIKAHSDNVTYDQAQLVIEQDKDMMFDKTFPVISVTQEAGTAWVLTNSPKHMSTNAMITPRSTPNEIGAEYKSVSYTTDRYALRYFVPDDDVERYGNGALLTQLGTTEVTNALRWHLEDKFIKTFLDPSTKWKTKFTGQASATQLTSGKLQHWSDGAVDILKDIKGMVETNLKYAGKLKMNRAMISKDLWDVVCENPDVYNRMQANTDTPKTDMGLQQAFATLIGVEQLNVIEDVEATGLDKVRDVTDYATYSPDFEFKRTLKGLFAMYHYEPTATLQSKCAGVVINVRNRRINYNNGVPIFKTYRHADEGIEGTWIDGRIRAGFHMSNPAGLILATGLLPD